MIEIKNIYGKVIARVENPGQEIRDVRGEQVCTIPDDQTFDLNLSYMDLHGADLRGWDLSMADFYDTDLTGADLTGADLHESSIWCAKLDEAILDDADLPARHHHNHCC
jgi:hypothetical protein